MKQHITKKQWDELSDKQKVKFAVMVDGSLANPLVPIVLNIGQMIEFLGDDWYKDLFTGIGGDVFIDYANRADNLCDWLLEAVKKKLKV